MSVKSARSTSCRARMVLPCGCRSVMNALKLCVNAAVIWSERTGCGLCGTETLKQAIRPVDPVQPVDVSDNAIHKALAVINQSQPLQQATGATHAAAWCDLQGNILHVREDVVRHNALDKLIGAFKKTDLSTREGFVLATTPAAPVMKWYRKAPMPGLALWWRCRHRLHWLSSRHGM